MIEKIGPNKLLLLLMVLFVVCAIMNESLLQVLLIVFMIFVLNWYLFLRLRTGKKMMYIVSLLICLLLVVTYWQHSNAVNMGFENGIISGVIGQNLYTDTAFYYDEATQLSSDLATNPLLSYLKGELPQYGFYGPYNLYVLWNAILCLLFGKNVMVWVLIKLSFTIVSYYYVFLIGRYFLSEKFSLVAVILYGLYPGNILAAVTLMRDNIMSLLIILFYYFIADRSGKKRMLLYAELVGVTMISFILRGYSVVLFLPLLLYVQIKKFHKPRHIVYLVVAVVAFVPIATLFLNVEFINHSFVALQQAKDFFASGGSFSVFENRSSGMNSVIFAVYYGVFGSSPSFKTFELGVVQEVLDYLSYIYLNIVLAISTMSIVYIFRNKIIGRDLCLLFGAAIPIFYLSLYTFAFGGPVPRIYNLTIWINAIAIGLFLQYATRRQSVVVLSSTVIFAGGIYFIKAVLL